MASGERDAIEIREEEFLDDFDPQTAMGRIMIKEMARCSIRMERSGRQEAAAVDMKVRHAKDDFEEGRIEEAEQLFDILGDNPRARVRKLRRSPEGIDLLIEAWFELRDSLDRPHRPVWTPWHRERAENLTGFRLEEAEGSQIFALSRAICGDFSDLGDPEGGDLDAEARKDWACLRLIERIDAEVAGLEAHLRTIDFRNIALDREQAGHRAMFDPSKDAILARRYDAEATRGFYKALGEVRRAEREFAAQAAEDATPDPKKDCGQLASFRDRDVPLPREPRPTDPRPHPRHEPVSQSPQTASATTVKPPFGPT